MLNADAEAVKRALLEVIAAKHPDVPSRVTREQYIAVRRFISRFARIYSVNYDLLLYWAINQRELDPPSWETNDGFLTGRAWTNRDQQKVFFLHGALHLYQSEEGTKKLAFENGRTIIDAVRGNLKNDIFPLYVSESSSEEKRAKITGNPYLDFCLRQVTLEEGSIVVVGHAFSETDQHIFDAINASRVGRVYVGLYRDPDSPANARTRGNATGFLHQKGRDVQFFDTETAPIWR